LIWLMLLTVGNLFKADPFARRNPMSVGKSSRCSNRDKKWRRPTLEESVVIRKGDS
jgi:hypothetical protein